MPYLFRTLRSEILVWFGVFGSAITLLSSIGPILQLADWARFLIHNWKDALRSLWLPLFSWLHIDLDPTLVTLLSMTLFFVVMALGSRITAFSGPEVSGEHSQEKNHGLFHELLLYIPLIVLISVVVETILGLEGFLKKNSSVWSALVEFVEKTVAVALLLSLMSLPLLWVLKSAKKRRVLKGVFLYCLVAPAAWIVLFGVAMLLVPDEESTRKIAAGFQTFLSNALSNSGFFVLTLIGLYIVLMAVSLIFVGPLLAILTADRRRMFSRMLRSVALVGVLLVLNGISLYGSRLQELVQPPTFSPAVRPEATSPPAVK